MKTQESNKLIAEFMGWKEQTDPTERWFGDWFNGSVRETDGIRKPLLFHTSWDWLIPVVEKIESFIFQFPVPDTYYEVRLLGGVYVSIISNNGDELISIDNAETKLEATYKAVVEFIKWYNENKK